MGRQVPTRAGVGASGPAGGTCLRQSCCLMLLAGWLSSGQTIGAVRTAVRSACCLPELRVANRLRRLCPLGTRFPTFPPCTPFGPYSARRAGGMGLRAHQRASLRQTVGAFCPRRGQKSAPPCAPPFFPSPFPYSGSPQRPRCRIAFFFFFSFAAERKRRPPSFRLNLLHSGTSFSKEFRAGEKERGRLSNRGFPCFSRLDMP